MAIPQETVSAIYAATDIVEVIQDYVPLKKRGANYWGLSPFKAERTPSFTVSPAKQIFKDFSSGKGGTAVTFLMELEGYSYPEALRHLARKYGIEVPEADAAADGVQKELRETLLACNAWASGWMQEQLQTPEGRTAAWGYLKERGLTDGTIQQYGLGYCPEAWDALTQAALKAQWKEDILLRLGLVGRSEKGTLYDRFRGRVMFPIQDVAGRMVGFGGRILKSDAQAAKYLNSPESELYNKSELLYGLFQARQAIRTTGAALLAEGYMDVLALHQAGLNHAVASSGTALTPEQVRLLGRYCKRIILLYDGDEAGIKAAERGVDLIAQAGLSAAVLILPQGHDPDSYLKAHGPVPLQQLLDTATEDWLSFRHRLLTQRLSPADPSQHAQMIHELAASVALLPDEVSQGTHAAQAARLLGIEPSLFHAALHRALQRTSAHTRNERTGTPQADATPETVVATPRPGYAAEKEVLRLVLSFYSASLTSAQGGEMPLVSMVAEGLQGQPLAHPTLQAVWQQCLNAWESAQALPLDHLLHHMGPEVNALVAELLTDPYELAQWEKRGFHDVPARDGDLAETVNQALIQLQWHRLEALRATLQAELKAAQEPEAIDRLLQRHKRLEALRTALSQQLGRVVSSPATGKPSIP